MENYQDKYRIEHVEDDESKHMSYRIRHKMYVEKLGFEKGQGGIEKDSYDEKAMHFLMYDNSTNEAIGCFRLIRGGAEKVRALMEGKMSDSDLEFSRLVILPQWQGGEAIKTLVKWVGQYTRENDIDLLHGVMERSMARILRVSGFNVEQASPVFEFKGKRAVYYIRH